MRTTDLYGTVPGPRRVSPATRRAATGAHGTSARRSARHAGTPVPTGGDAATGPAAGWRGGHRRAARQSLPWWADARPLLPPHVPGDGLRRGVDGGLVQPALAAAPRTTRRCAQRGTRSAPAHLAAWPVSSSAAPRWDRTPHPRWYGSSCSRCSWSASTGCSSAGPHLPARLVDRDADRLPQRAQLMHQAESLPVLPGLNLTAALPLAVWPQRDDAPLGRGEHRSRLLRLGVVAVPNGVPPCIEDGIGGCS
ncbi:hypothetical protein GA0070215_106202 [Micromonospora marina]|uniref:Uncharacterized protein n=1 Tax=Micromonospora marina TaxID=307120 RepID=A0A1C4X822_9ACTN|nr:hypothetical protein GA0070215_106202 [Micromonospora marina]